jgi:hypothetical protein
VTRLEQALRALGMRLEDEPTPDIASAIAGRLAATPQARTRHRSRARRRVLALCLVALLAAAATAVASSSAVRHQARVWLRAVGIGTSVSERAGTAPVVSLAGAGLGAPISATDAARRLCLRTLPHPFGRPVAVFATGQAVTLAWPARNGLPPTGVRAVGALLTIENRATAADPFLLGKVLSSANTVEFVRLPGADDDQAVWIAGAPTPCAPSTAAGCTFAWPPMRCSGGSGPTSTGSKGVSAAPPHSPRHAGRSTDRHPSAFSRCASMLRRRRRRRRAGRPGARHRGSQRRRLRPNSDVSAAHTASSSRPSIDAAARCATARVNGPRPASTPLI